MSTPPTPTPPAPSWPHCAHGADPAGDPVGCRGVHVPGHTACLAHLADNERDAYLAGLSPGADIDHRGTSFTGPLLSSLLQALRDPATSTPRLGDAGFDGAEFTGDARFDRAEFTGDAWFDGAQFSGIAGFEEARFSGDVELRRARFSGDARFSGAQFFGTARFRRARFSSTAGFNRAEFSGNARFPEAQFSGDARFDEAQFSGHARFDRAEFTGDAGFSWAEFSGNAEFDEARFSGDVGFRETRFGMAGFGGAQFSGTAMFSAARFSGDAWFGVARFSGDARFDGAQFSGNAGFDEAEFSGINAGFFGAEFSRDARFNKAEFSGDAGFNEARFSGYADFVGTRFSGDAWFGLVEFSNTASFARAEFSGTAGFGGTQFSSDARFTGARFAVMSRFGPVVCAKTIDLSSALFEAPVTLEIAAREVRCVRTRWESTATARLRYASADLSHAVLSFPVAVNAHPAPFTNGGAAVGESLLAGSARGVRVVSVQGVDAAHLLLTDTDLTDCLFSGAFHLDQLRLEGRCTFASAPAGLHHRGIRPVRWTRRRTLAEEHHWRAQTTGQQAPVPGQAPSPHAWRPGPHHPDPGLTPDPEDVAAVYRQLRKAFEDGKNEPGAADFYYGEMEMRRCDRTGTPPGERGLLWGYWLLSGYGLRASRALAWLVAAMGVTVVLIMGLGLADSTPRQLATGTVPADGGQVTLAVDKQDPRLTLSVADRFTAERFDKALQVVLNSVVFRSSGQDLTTWGTYTEMVSRFTEPALLTLAILAMRNRIKR